MNFQGIINSFGYAKSDAFLELLIATKPSQIQLQPMRENSAESVSELSHSTLRKADTVTSATNTAPISPRCNGAALGGGRGERSHVQQVRRGEERLRKSRIFWRESRNLEREV